MTVPIDERAASAVNPGFQSGEEPVALSHLQVRDCEEGLVEQQGAVRKRCTTEPTHGEKGSLDASLFCALLASI